MARANGVLPDNVLVNFGTAVTQMLKPVIVQAQGAVLMDEAGETIANELQRGREFDHESRSGRMSALTYISLALAASGARTVLAKRMKRADAAWITQNTRRDHGGLMHFINRNQR
jgi:hypothetical protein